MADPTELQKIDPTWVKNFWPGPITRRLSNPCTFLRDDHSLWINAGRSRTCLTGIDLWRLTYSPPWHPCLPDWKISDHILCNIWSKYHRWWSAGFYGPIRRQISCWPMKGFWWPKGITCYFLGNPGSKVAITRRGLNPGLDPPRFEPRTLRLIPSLMPWPLGHGNPKLLNKLRHIHEKMRLILIDIRFMSQFFMYIPKYLSIAQFLPNVCLTFPAGLAYPFNIFVPR